ncbi:ABC-type branched-subunit amino acid transport system substrate-binding protein [Kitasatospora gansuensis]|uniref:ABC-type branched-subunit amino acid transport system substrate-binding protein n=1 Tax=Kitasatospora gansuensis TaxID=258050 RepID=A0A7W7SGH8_9ACTN|nr:ABC transporter substrate-binding protein [Kitasatospora gansuensis]MBB4950043.1 ABC-type branched-subunit amino acid transport system substrate-binding protein [Kitasatospora gansuensis]
MRTTRLAAAVAVLALTATACSTKGSSADGTLGKDGVKTGPGVTDSTITMAALTDLTGPYASLGKSIVNAQQLWVDQTNANGGICGRKLRIVVKDHGYDVQKAVAAFTEVEPDTALLTQVIGSPVVAAIKQDLNGKHLLALPMAWASTMLGQPYIQVVGSTYDVDMITGVDFLTRKAGLVAGDRIGHVYFEGEYGENALAGSKYAAEKGKLTLVEQKIKPTDQDLTAQVSALREAGVKAVLISAGPKQTAALVGAAAGQGLTVPVLSSAPGFAPQLLDTAVGPALERQLSVVSAISPVSADVSAMRVLVQDYQAKYPGAPVDSGVASGWSAAQVAAEALGAACAEKDLTREGIAAAHRKTTALNILGVPMNFSDVTKAPTRQAYILKPAKGVTGGLTTVEGAHEVKP